MLSHRHYRDTLHRFIIIIIIIIIIIKNTVIIWNLHTGTHQPRNDAVKLPNQQCQSTDI